MDVEAEKTITISGDSWFKTRWKYLAVIIITVFGLGGYVIKNENELSSHNKKIQETENSFSVIKKLMIAQMEIQIKLARKDSVDINSELLEFNKIILEEK